jgi:ABC-type molybdate transport system substrate-binding protein
MQKKLAWSLSLVLALAAPAGAWPTGEEMEAWRQEDAAFKAAADAARGNFSYGSLLAPDRRDQLVAYMAGPPGDLVPPDGRAELAAGLVDRQPGVRAGAARVLTELAKAAGPNLARRERAAWARRVLVLLAPREDDWRVVQEGLRALDAMADPAGLAATRELARQASRAGNQPDGGPTLPPMSRWQGSDPREIDICEGTARLAQAAVSSMLLGPAAPPRPPADLERKPADVPADLAELQTALERDDDAGVAGVQRRRPALRRLVAALGTGAVDNAFRSAVMWVIRMRLQADPGLARELAAPLGRLARHVRAAQDAGLQVSPALAYLRPAGLDPWLALADLQEVEDGLDLLLDRVPRTSQPPLQIYLPENWEPALQAEAAAFRHATGQQVDVHVGTTAGTLAALRRHQPVDLLITADDQELAAGRRAGLLAPGAVPLLADRLVLWAWAQGMERVTATVDLRAPGIRFVLAPPAETLGRKGRELLPRLPGGAQLLAGHPRVQPWGTENTYPAKEGPPDAGFALASQTSPNQGLVFLPLPPDLPARVQYRGVLARQPRSPATARAFLWRIGSREGLERLRQWGFEVP